MRGNQQLQFFILTAMMASQSRPAALNKCFWSFCQSSSRIRQGCQPTHLYSQVESRSCYGGTMHQCCPLSRLSRQKINAPGSESNSIDAPLTPDLEEAGICSWYGSGGDVPNGAYTASGERFNKYSITAAHKTLPFGTRIRVTYTKNGNTVDVSVNDRGPFLPKRILDLSYAAFGVLENPDKGLISCSYTILP